MICLYSYCQLVTSALTAGEEKAVRGAPLMIAYLGSYPTKPSSNGNRFHLPSRILFLGHSTAVNCNPFLKINYTLFFPIPIFFSYSWSAFFIMLVVWSPTELGAVQRCRR